PARRGEFRSNYEHSHFHNAREPIQNGHQQERARHRSAGSQRSEGSGNREGEAKAGEQTKHRNASETEGLQRQTAPEGNRKADIGRQTDRNGRLMANAVPATSGSA